MNRLLTILLLAAGTAYGQINNPPTPSSIGLGPTNDVIFANVTITNYGSLTLSAEGEASVFVRNDNGDLGLYGDNGIVAHKQIYFTNSNDASATRDNLGLGSTNNVIFSNVTVNGALTAANIAFTNNYFTNPTTFSTNVTVNGDITANGTLAVTGNVILSGVNNTATAQTADSASSLMTRGLSDVRYLGEMWNASKMAAYATTNPSVTVFLNEPMVTYTNLQPQGPFMQEFIAAEKYAGKTVKVLAYCRVNSTNGGNVQGVGRIQYLTNTAGGPDSNLALSPGGAAHATIGVFTNASTDVFPVATSTNQYLIFTSNVGVISNNAKMIIVSFGFNRAHANTTFTNNLYMQAVQLVVE